MITLRPIDESNFLQAAALRVHTEQHTFVQPASLILARAYAYRKQRGICWGIYHGGEIVGLAMMHDMDEEPSCYHLCEFMIDQRFQGRGYGQNALNLILSHCRREAKYPRVEVCVKHENAAAIHVYEKAGFRDTGYIGPETPDCLSMVFALYREIRYCDIILRDMREADIADWIHWYNVETEWSNWDAPDEELEPVDPETFRIERMETLNWKWENDFRNFFELDTADGHHIGMVTSYAIGDDYNWMSWKEARASGNFRHTIGIDICDSRFWGRGLGTQAITAFSKHFLDNGFSDICLQTWSGNIRMIRAAQRIGFVECNRIVGNRQIRGGTYDSLTFHLNLDIFHKYLSENP